MINPITKSVRYCLQRSQRSYSLMTKRPSKLMAHVPIQSGYTVINQHASIQPNRQFSIDTQHGINYDINNFFSYCIKNNTLGPTYYYNSYNKTAECLKNFILANDIQLTPNILTKLESLTRKHESLATIMVSIKSESNMRQIDVVSSRLLILCNHNIKFNNDINEFAIKKEHLYQQMFDQIKIRPENPTFNYLCHCILNIIPNNIERHPIPIQNPFLMQLLDELGNDRFIVNLLHITSNQCPDIMLTNFVTTILLSKSETEKNLWFNFAMYTLKLSLPMYPLLTK